jgi:hypothetical protein
MAYSDGNDDGIGPHAITVLEDELESIRQALDHSNIATI